MQSPGGTPMPGGGVSTSQSPPFAVPIRYMMLGILCFGLFAIDVAFQSPALALGDPGAPNVVAVTHLLTLGALLAFVMGAVYQLTTVAFLIPISSVPAARFNFWLFLVSLAGLFVSMARWWGTGLLIFGCLMVIAIYIYAGVMMASLFRTRVRGPMFGFVTSAHAYLILAVSVAVLLVLDDSGTVPALDHVLGELIATHIVLAIGGFFTFLLMGFSFKLLPMFTLSHGFATHRQKWTLTGAHLALWLLIAGIWVHLTALMWAGGIVGIAALVSHLIDVRGIVKKRMRRKIEPPIRAVMLAFASGIVGLGLLLAGLIWQHGQAAWQTVVLLYLLGTITWSVMGFAYKIVPFLVWTKRHSKQKEKGKPVLISDLINPNHSIPVLVGVYVGLVVLACSSILEWRIGAIAGSLLITLAMLVFCVQIFKVIDLTKALKELTERD